MSRFYSRRLRLDFTDDRAALLEAIHQLETRAGEREVRLR
jgi:hypothetical protein